MNNKDHKQLQVIRQLILKCNQIRKEMILGDCPKGLIKKCQIINYNQIILNNIEQKDILDNRKLKEDLKVTMHPVLVLALGQHTLQHLLLHNNQTTNLVQTSNPNHKTQQVKLAIKEVILEELLVQWEKNKHRLELMITTYQIDSLNQEVCYNKKMKNNKVTNNLHNNNMSKRSNGPITPPPIQTMKSKNHTMLKISANTQTTTLPNGIMAKVIQILNALKFIRTTLLILRI